MSYLYPNQSYYGLNYQRQNQTSPQQSPVLNPAQQNSLQQQAKQVSTWTEETSEQLAQAGYCEFQPAKDSLERPSFYIAQRVSAKPGFGTASTREIVKQSLAKGCGGRFHNQASQSAHLFHLYMGMEPIDKKFSYIFEIFGRAGTRALQKYSEIKELLSSKSVLSHGDQSKLGLIKNIISVEEGYENSDEVTNEKVVSYEGKIEDLKKRTISSLQLFIEDILEILEKNPNEKRPETEHLGKVDMVVSEEGLNRWKEAIQQKKPFVPFKKLEHLRPHMTEKQIKRLDAIMQQREAILGND